MSGSDLVILNAKERIKHISSVELNLVVERLSEEFIKQPENKRLNVFKGLIDLSVERNECAEFVVQKISSFPSKFITLQMKKYADNLILLAIPASEDMSKLIQNWKNK